MPARRAPTQAPPEFIAPQLATLVSAPPKGAGWAYEIKLDGYRILARINGKDVRMFTRKGKDWTADMRHLADELARLPTKSAWLDGEIVVLGANGLPEFNALQNAFDRKGTEQLVYFVFDLLYLNGRDVQARELRERRALLEELFSDFEQDRVRLSQTFDADGGSVLQSACKMGLEGIIAKRLNAPYRSGARTDTWQKVKCQLRQEFVVGGFTKRTGSGREVGSLIRPGIFSNAKASKVLTKTIKEAEKRVRSLKASLTNVLKDPAANDPVYKACQRIFHRTDALVLTRDDALRHVIRRRAFRRFLHGCPPRKRDDTSIGDAIN
jgi:bifunctional non-homologous end joining protein LigD